MQYILSDGAWFGLPMRPAFVGLLLWCSYPVNDMRLSLAIANKIEHTHPQKVKTFPKVPLKTWDWRKKYALCSAYIRKIYR